MPTSEELTRINIDKQLTACGWIVQSRAEINLCAGHGIAVREFLLSMGEADYLLFVDRKAVGVVEAKYSVGLPSNIPHVWAGQAQPRRRRFCMRTRGWSRLT